MKQVRQKSGNSPPLDQIKESESESSDTVVYPSGSDAQSGNEDRIVTSQRLSAKGQQIKSQKNIKGGGNSSADDKPLKGPPKMTQENIEKKEAKKKEGLAVRTASGLALFLLMVLVFTAGHVYYSLFLLFCGFKCYFELININRNPIKDKKNSLLTTLDWYFPICYSFYLIPKTFIRRVLVDNDSVYNFKQEWPTVYTCMYVHHTFISAMMLVGAMVLFTLSLEKGQYRYQFKRLGWQILSCIIPITGALLFPFYVYKGYYWLVMTNITVMINDIMAYVFGKTFGRTKLIALSPNKTMEGFIGGGASTIFFAVVISGYIQNYQMFVCPQKEIIFKPFQPLSCDRPQIYDQKMYDLPVFFGPFQQILISPAQIHGAVIALFASVIAPFGGFFASGLKRGLKIKDFADSIPGHGGFADRFDCHIVIAFFVYIYLTQIVYKSSYGKERIFDYILQLDEKDRFDIFEKLSGMYNNTQNI